ncbi:MAG: formylglycine-generating enzyme family protein [Planctomycetota bacterium]|nr:formylglycine-generating enzyme family protein [Planctomycetota bacterium]
MRANVLRCLILAVTCGFAGSSIHAEPTTPGISKSRPKSGPFVEIKGGYMVPYSAKIPGTDAVYEMVPIPGGTFVMGSPATEKGRKAHEGPQFEVRVEPFWMGKYEVTWAEYKSFMSMYNAMKDIVSFRNTLRAGATANKSIKQRKAALLVELKNNKLLDAALKRKVADVDAITAPTRLYEPSFTFAKGADPRQPAVTMTQYAAKQYTKWLSKLTGQSFRLPTEAEWEYACRAGSKTAYSFGDDPAKLKDYAWFAANSDSRQQKVGLLKPNAFGLYDMHGNVAEWVYDELTEKYPSPKKQPVDAVDAVAWPEVAFPRVVRGGHWDSSASEVRAAHRLGSDDEAWKLVDPNIPLSPWWYTSDPARGVGMRIVRTLDAPDEKLRKKYWEIDHDDILFDVEDRLAEGRGVKENVSRDLQQVIQQVLTIKKKIDKE